MRIVIASGTYYPNKNGQAVFTTRLAEGLAQAGHEVMVIAPATGSHPKPSVINKVQVQRISSFQLTRINPDVDFSLFPAGEVNRLLDDFQPDVAHIQDHYPSCAAVVRWMRARQWPVVGTNHFLPDNLFQYASVMKWNRPLFDRATWQWALGVFNRVQLATTPTRTAAQILRGQNIRVPVLPISCGVDTRRFRPNPAVDRAAMRRKYGLDPSLPVIMFVGRIDREKRLDVLLRAAQVAGRDDFQLAIVGRGCFLSEYRALARDLQLERRVIFTGFVPDEDLPALHNSTDLFAMPSTAELQSIATLEAMACGKPVLAADARALPELVTDGDNGYLFRPNDPADAARRISQLLDERNRWAAMGQASVARATQHSLHDTIRRYEEVYAWLMPLRRAAPVRPPRFDIVQRYLGSL